MMDTVMKPQFIDIQTTYGMIGKMQHAFADV
jgi:hypothetical protein